jgi:probable HAF family extracellular repeat protein
VRVPGAGEPQGTVLDLGTLGGADALAHDVNTWGTVTGQSTTPDDMYHAFLTLPGRTMVALRAFGEGESRGFGINDVDDVVGVAERQFDEVHAFRQSGTTVRDLGEGTARAVNNLREVVGSGFGFTAGPSAWSPTGEGRLLAPPGYIGEALDINDRGQIVGWVAPGFGAFAQAVIWEPDGRMVDLGASTGGIASVASGINEFGDVVGWYYTADDLTSRAFLWRRGSGVVDLFPPGVGSAAYDVNHVGQVVGVTESPAGDGSVMPFLWSAGSGAVSLPVPVSRSSEARAINDFGEIVGWRSGSGVDESGPARALWWYEPPAVARQFHAIRWLIAVLAADHVIGHGHATALTAQARNAERAWRAGDGPRAARQLRALETRVERFVTDPRRSRHLEAFLTRLSLGLETSRARR